MELETQDIVWNTTPAGRSVFTKFRVFPISTSVDITVYQHGKNVLYFFYNIAQKNTKLLQCVSGGKFSVFTSSYVNTALDQSAIRIHKCYITIIYISKFRFEPKSMSDNYVTYLTFMWVSCFSLFSVRPKLRGLSILSGRVGSIYKIGQTFNKIFLCTGFLFYSFP